MVAASKLRSVTGWAFGRLTLTYGRKQTLRDPAAPTLYAGRKAASPPPQIRDDRAKALTFPGAGTVERSKILLTWIGAVV